MPSASAWLPEMLRQGPGANGGGRVWRGARSGAEEHREARALPGRDYAQRQRLVAGDVAVAARRHRGGPDLVGDREGLRRLAVVVAGPERGDVGRGDLGLAAELPFEEADGPLGGPVVPPPPPV